MEAKMDVLVVSCDEARRQLGDISIATLYRLFERGELDKRKVGGRTVVTMASIRNILGMGTEA